MHVGGVHVEMSVYLSGIEIYMFIKLYNTGSKYSECSMFLSFSMKSCTFCMLRRCGIYIYLCTFTIGPCLLMCFLQRGMTPVMLAAGKGHTGVVDLLVHKYNCSLTDVDKVSVFNVLGCESPVGIYVYYNRHFVPFHEQIG